jgi:hypothetical protein
MIRVGGFGQHATFDPVQCQVGFAIALVRKGAGCGVTPGPFLDFVGLLPKPQRGMMPSAPLQFPVKIFSLSRLLTNGVPAMRTQASRSRCSSAIAALLERSGDQRQFLILKASGTRGD